MWSLQKPISFLLFIFLPDRNDTVLVVFQGPLKGLTQESTSESHSTGHSANFCWRGKMYWLFYVPLHGSGVWQLELSWLACGTSHRFISMSAFPIWPTHTLSLSPHNVKYGVTERLLMLVHKTFVSAWCMMGPKGLRVRKLWTQNLRTCSRCFCCCHFIKRVPAQVLYTTFISMREQDK